MTICSLTSELKRRMFNSDRKIDLKADNKLCHSTKDAKDNDLYMGRLESRSAKTETFAQTKP